MYVCFLMLAFRNENLVGNFFCVLVEIIYAGRDFLDYFLTQDKRRDIFKPECSEGKKIR